MYSFLKEVENLQIFSLCKDFEELSLCKDSEDNCSSSSTQVQPSRSAIPRILRRLKQSLLSPGPSIIEQLRAPFVEYPRQFLDSSFQSYDIRMLLIGFRFLPGFLHHELQLPESFDRLTFLRNSLGLTYNRIPLTEDSLFSFSHSGVGLRSLVNSTAGITKILVEVITFYNGLYGRYLVLVTLGVGCTVWYAFAPGTDIQPPLGGVFSPFDSYDPFFNTDYFVPGFRCVGFVESHDVSASVASALGNEPPFAEITIPASGPVLKAVGLGVMVAIFLAIGIVPNVSGPFNIQL